MFQNVESDAADDNTVFSLLDLFPIGADVFMLGNPHYGCQGQVGYRLTGSTAAIYRTLYRYRLHTNTCHTHTVWVLYVYGC